MSDDDDRTLERFVAGLPVGADELAHAITSRAVERSIVVKALVDGLADPDPTIRLRLARRAARMSELDPAIAARLAVLGGLDEDPRVRSAGAKALRAHGLAVPGEPAPEGAPATRAPGGLRLHLRRAADVRADDATPGLVPRWREDARGLFGRSVLDGSGRPRVEFEGLPAAWVGTTPALRATGRPAVVGVAESAVSDDGSAVVWLRPPEGATIDEVAGWLEAGAELFVPEG